MTDSNDAIDAIRQAAEQLLPGLSERLGRYGLGEIEVRHGALRLRVAASASAAVVAEADAGSSSAGTASAPRDGGTDAPGRDHPRPAAMGAAASSGHGIISPAVGFFVYADGLGPGLAVDKGDALGWVEMLGVRHDVRAPRRGTVRSLVAESGEAVEYGQVVLELDPSGTSR